LGLTDFQRETGWAPQQVTSTGKGLTIASNSIPDRGLRSRAWRAATGVSGHSTISNAAPSARFRGTIGSVSWSPALVPRRVSSPWCAGQRTECRRTLARATWLALPLLSPPPAGHGGRDELDQMDIRLQKLHFCCRRI